MSRYASKTTVGADRSRSEIEKILGRYGASAFMYASEPGRAWVIFVANGRRIKMVLPLPALTDFEYDTRNHKRPLKAQQKSQDQEIKRRWRALALVVKAKLEAVDSMVATFEQEFLAYTMLPGTPDTVGDKLLLQVEQAYQGSKAPLLLLN
jgi:hypothetical protein